MIDLDELERLARAAMESGINQWSSEPPVGLMNPTTVLEMVAEIRAARAEIAEVRRKVPDPERPEHER